MVDEESIRGREFGNSRVEQDVENEGKGRRERKEVGRKGGEERKAN